MGPEPGPLEFGSGSARIQDQSRRWGKQENRDLKKEGADIFEIVFIGAVPATMVILVVGVIPGDARQEA